jgi:AraC-like DNA-binding protein
MDNAKPSRNRPLKRRPSDREPPATMPTQDQAGPEAWSVTLHEKIYAPLKIAALIQVLAKAGVPAESALAGSGLALAEIANPMTLTSIQQLLIVGRNAGKLWPSPGLGLQAGLQMHASAYGLYGYALLCSVTLRNAWDMAVRYQRLATPVMKIRWFEEADRAIWVLPGYDEIRHLDLGWDDYVFFLDMQLAIHTTLVKDLMGPSCAPAHARYTTAEPGHAEEIARSLECPVSFNQPRNELHYPLQWLDRAPHLANSITAAQMSSTCARLIEQFKWHAGIARRVYEEITRTPGRFPEMDAVARDLCLSTRTLRRRLESEGTSYSALLSSVRHALAVDYLRTTKLSADDVAQALGFSDTASFRHSFKRWTGMTPNEFRG